MWSFGVDAEHHSGYEVDNFFLAVVPSVASPFARHDKSDTVIGMCVGCLVDVFWEVKQVETRVAHSDWR